MNICPVIMCGGAGTRLWPLSRPERPKQFLKLIGGQSLFEATLDRCMAIAGLDHIVIVTGKAHAGQVREQLGEAADRATVLIEPSARDSAPAMAAAAAWLITNRPGVVALFLASDHHIPDREAFAEAIDATVGAARDGKIVTLGVRPTYPSGAYGYIKPENPKSVSTTPVQAFVEKPDAQTARRYIADGFLWNSGNFVARPDALLDALKTHALAVEEAATRAVSAAQPIADGTLLAASFAEAPKISIDYAVMEKTDRAQVLPVTFAWSDLGAWNAVKDALDADPASNVVTGQVALIDVAGSYVRAEPGVQLAVSGVNDIAVIADKGAVLVCPLSRSQDVKALAAEVGARSASHDAGPQGTLEAYGARFKHWLDTAALPLWSTLGASHPGSDHPPGFLESLNADAHPTGAHRRMRVQPRQAYAYALSGQMGWRGPWTAMVDLGLKALESQYQRPDGLFATLVDHQTGAILDETAKTYDQAFALLGFAAGHMAERDRGGPGTSEAKARALADALWETRGDALGGVREDGAATHLSNPQMHLFEAMIEWSELSSDPVWAERRDAIGRLALERLIGRERGYLLEQFDETWHPDPTAMRIEPGHQFEWAWLLARWSRQTGNSDAHTAALVLFEAGRKGVDPARGLAMNALDENGTPSDANARFWPQTEWLKAALLLGSVKDADPRFLEEARLACAAMARYLDHPTRGLWHDRADKDGRMASGPAPASTLYHIVGAVFALGA